MRSPPRIPLSLLAGLLVLGSSFPVCEAQQRKRGGGNRFAEMEKKAVAEPFVGITNDGKVEEGLFGIKSTGVATTAVKRAAEAFLAGLTAQQRTKTCFPVDDDEWRRWANQHSLPRQGVCFEEPFFSS